MRRLSRALPMACALLLPLCMTGCGGEPESPPRAFTPPNYAYLTKIRLNVGEVEIDDHSTPGGGNTQSAGEDVSAVSPTPPSVALTEMAHDRVFPAGTSGKAVFVIDQANILRAPNGSLSGVLAVHLDLLTATGARGGYAEARVARQHVPGSDAEDERGVLYDMTNQMMADMNVELEFQVRKTLKDWLISGTSVPLPVEAQPLQPALPPIPFATQPFQPAQPAQPSLPPPTEYGAPGSSEPQQPQMSPPPGYLQAPPGAQPVSPGY